MTGAVTTVVSGPGDVFSLQTLPLLHSPTGTTAITTGNTTTPTVTTTTTTTNYV